MPPSGEPRTDEVHVWVLSLALPPAEANRLRRTLSVSERGRADAQDDPRRRRRSLCRLGLRRAVLAAYLGCRPEQVPLRSEPGHKPVLAGGEFHFNCSSSGDLAVLGLARTRRVGVDVERLRPVTDPLGIADWHFTGAEHAQLCDVPEPERDEAFLSCWTRKEAYVKGRGDGLARALDSFQVTVAPWARLPPAENLGHGPEELWSLQAFVPEAGYVAAVAAEGEGWQARCRRW